MSFCLARPMCTIKRNNDHIVRILTELADTPSQLLLSQFVDCPEFTDEILEAYIEFLMQRGLIEPEGHKDYQITWEGHDFLGCSRDAVIWRAATQVAGHLSFECFYAILKDLVLWKARKVAEEYWQNHAEKKFK